MHILSPEIDNFFESVEGRVYDPRKYFITNLIERMLPDWAGSYDWHFTSKRKIQPAHFSATSDYSHRPILVFKYA